MPTAGPRNAADDRRHLRQLSLAGERVAARPGGVELRVARRAGRRAGRQLERRQRLVALGLSVGSCRE